MKPIILCKLVCILFVLLVCHNHDIQNHQPGLKYRIEALALPKQHRYGWPDRVNNEGIVIGRVGINDDIIGISPVYWKGTMPFLLDPEASREHAINSQGDIVGEIVGENGVDHAALWRDGKPILLTPDLPKSTSASGVSDKGMIVGNVGGSDEPDTIFLWDRGSIRLISELKQRSAYANDINDQGTLVGWFLPDKSRRLHAFQHSILHAFRYSKGHFEDLKTPEEVTQCSAERVNNRNQTIVNGEDREHNRKSAFLWDAETRVQLPGFPGHSNIRAMDLNNRGDVVGTAEVSEADRNYLGKKHRFAFDIAFLYHHHQMIDLNTLIPVREGWRLLYAASINDSGMIVGVGLHHGRKLPFQMIPVTGGHGIPGKDDERNRSQ